MAYDRKRNHDMFSLRAQKVDKSKSEQTFEVKFTSAFTTMREDLEKTAKETNTYVDKTLDIVHQLEELHLRRHGLQTIKEYANAQKEKFDNLYSTYSSLLNELAPRCAQTIQLGEEATQVQSDRMQKSRKDTMNTAKRRLDEGRERQLLATDATELMKYYKALIMAT